MSYCINIFKTFDLYLESYQVKLDTCLTGQTQTTKPAIFSDDTNFVLAETLRTDLHYSDFWL